MRVSTAALLFMNGAILALGIGLAGIHAQVTDPAGGQVKYPVGATISGVLTSPLAVQVIDGNGRSLLGQVGPGQTISIKLP